MTRRIHTCGALALLLPLLATPDGLAQTARLQFIHASPYAEAAVVDVYRDGARWLDDVGFTQATPFTDWPAGPVRVAVTPSGADGPEDAFFSAVLDLRAGETYVAVAAGDPRARPGQPDFALFVRDRVREVPSGPNRVEYLAFQGVPGARVGVYLRRYFNVQLRNRQHHDHPHVTHGTFWPYSGSPTLAFEADFRDAEGGLLLSVLDDRRALNNEVMVAVVAGLPHPVRPGDRGPIAFHVFPNGVTRIAPPNEARIQLVHNAPYREAAAVDVVVTRIDTVGTDAVVLRLEGLGFREASPFVDLPAGLYAAGDERTAPALRLAVTSAADGTPLLADTLLLTSAQTYVAVLAGDPLGRPGQPPMAFHVFGDWKTGSGRADAADLLFFHGAPDMPTADIGLEGTALPLAGNLTYGTIAPCRTVRAGIRTFTLAHADTRTLVSRFEAALGPADSSLVLLTSGFLNPPPSAVPEARLALLAARPGGGPLTVFAPLHPPAPWWRNGGAVLSVLLMLAGLGLIGNQIRIARLRTHRRELNALVDARTSELAAEQQKTAAQARRLAELDEAKNRFFANISHEFRTPLTLLLGPVQDALDGRYGEIDERMRRQLPVMQQNARRLLRLINQLLDLSRLQAGKLEIAPRPGDLVSALRDLAQPFVPLVERRRIEFTFETDADACSRRFDPDGLEKIVSNLLANAFRFTPEGGSVRLALRTRNPGPVEIEVSDDGPGIPVEDRERIFERFRQADMSVRRSHGGAGIGLALARELAELHGGTIVLDSAPGAGSTFVVRLPLAGAPAPERTSDEPAPCPAPKGATAVHPGNGEVAEAKDRPMVLIVDDNSDLRAYLRTVLEADYRLAEAEDGAQGLDLARRRRPDLVLADVMMPRMDGYELCRLLKAHDDLCDVPVVLLTAKAAAHDAVEGIRSGADAYVPKPFDPNVLRARLEQLLQARRVLRRQYGREVIVRPGEVHITPKEADFLERVLEVAEAHLGDSMFTIDWMADEVGFSRRQLERRVQDATGQSPSELLRGLRLERASQLLRARAGAVSEIAAMVGFRSAAHFSTVFREHYGVSPSEHGAEGG